MHVIPTVRDTVQKYQFLNNHISVLTLVIKQCSKDSTMATENLHSVLKSTKVQSSKVNEVRKLTLFDDLKPGSMESTHIP